MSCSSSPARLAPGRLVVSCCASASGRDDTGARCRELDLFINARKRRRPLIGARRREQVFALARSLIQFTFASFPQNFPAGFAHAHSVWSARAKLARRAELNWFSRSDLNLKWPFRSKACRRHFWRAPIKRGRLKSPEAFGLE